MRWRLVLAGLVCAAGIVLLARSLFFGTPAPRLVPGTVPEARELTGALAQLREQGRMLDVQAMPTDEDFSSELDDAIRREAAALSLSAGWSSSQLAGLVRSLSARAMLYIAPDFDKYVAQLDSLGTLATRPDSLELHGKPLTQERWTMYAEMTRPSAVGIDALELRFVFRDGAAVNQTARASHLSASDPGWYSRIDPHDPRTDVVELILPATLKDAEGTEFDGFLSFSVAWSKPHNKWVPFSTAITDPRGGDRFLMPPWF